MNREGGAARGGCGPRALHSGFRSLVLDPLTLPGTDGGNNTACPCFTAAQLELVPKRGDRPAPQPHGNPPQTRQRHSLPVSGTPVAPRPCAGPKVPNRGRAATRSEDPQPGLGGLCAPGPSALRTQLLWADTGQKGADGGCQLCTQPGGAAGDRDFLPRPTGPAPLRENHPPGPHPSVPLGNSAPSESDGTPCVWRPPRAVRHQQHVAALLSQGGHCPLPGLVAVLRSSLLLSQPQTPPAASHQDLAVLPLQCVQSAPVSLSLCPRGPVSVGVTGASPGLPAGPLPPLLPSRPRPFPTVTAEHRAPHPSPDRAPVVATVPAPQDRPPFS